MKLILARHGNTFGPGDTPVWVGAREDYPLVERGLEQARELAGALISADLAPSRIIAGPLKRTRLGADIIAEQTGFSGTVEIDDRLTEIDYGAWGGKSDDEIVAMYGKDAIHDWREHSVRPPKADWSPTEETLRTNALAVLESVRADSAEADNVLIVTSNGILRFYHAALYAGQKNPPPGKVKTGHLGMAELRNGTFEPLCWNLAPKDILSI